MSNPSIEDIRLARDHAIEAILAEKRKKAPELPDLTFLAALHEETLKKKLEPFDRLIEKKAKQVYALQSIDQFEVSEAEAERARKQLSYLLPELEAMFDIRTATTDLQAQYLQCSNYWAERAQAAEEKLMAMHRHAHWLWLDWATAEQELNTALEGEKILLEILLKSVANAASCSISR